MESLLGADFSRVRVHADVERPSCSVGAGDEALRSGGRPLDALTREQMERSFGCGFQAVRVHDDRRAARAAARLGAAAFTVGQDIGFAAGRYAPGTAAGHRLIAHELAHTVQQRGASGHAPPVASASPFEAQADSAAFAAAAGHKVTQPLSRSGRALARQEDEKERLFSDAEIEQSVGKIEDTAAPVGKGLRGVERVSLDIDEPVAVSKGGAWDDPANKRFLERTTNQLTKNDLAEVAPGPPGRTISLRAAKAEGPAAFRAVAEEMLTRNFSDVAELVDVTNEARAAMRNLNRPVRDLTDALNGSIRGRIAAGRSPSARLVNEAFRTVGVDPETLSTAPSTPQATAPAEVPHPGGSQTTAATTASEVETIAPTGSTAAAPVAASPGGSHQSTATEASDVETVAASAVKNDFVPQFAAEHGARVMRAGRCLLIGEAVYAVISIAGTLFLVNDLITKGPIQTGKEWGLTAVLTAKVAQSAGMAVAGVVGMAIFMPSDQGGEAERIAQADAIDEIIYEAFPGVITEKLMLCVGQCTRSNRQILEPRYTRLLAEISALAQDAWQIEDDPRAAAPFKRAEGLVGPSDLDKALAGYREATHPPTTFHVRASVGEDAANNREDVQRVAQRLHELGFLDQQSDDPRAIAEAIHTYQSLVLHLPKPDGRIDPRGLTETALRSGRKVSMALP